MLKMFDTIQNKILGLSASYASSPYTVVSFNLKDIVDPSVTISFLNGLDKGLAFYIWSDYSLRDYKEYIVNSVEYLNLPGEKQDIYLQSQLDKMNNDFELENWKLIQMYLGVGIAISELNKQGLRYRRIDGSFDFGKGLTLNKAHLNEVILFSEF